MYEIKNNNLEWKKTERKEYILSDSIYVCENLETSNYSTMTESRSIVPWGQKSQGRRKNYQRARGNFEDDDKSGH